MVLGSRAILRGRLAEGVVRGVVLVFRVIGWFSIAKQLCAASTTQSPAGCAGQNSGSPSGFHCSERTNACFSEQVEWNVPARSKKLDMDFHGRCGLRARMCEDQEFCRELFAADVRQQRVSRMRGFRHWKWHLDEMYVN
ncbi:hypothetical protein [Caenibius sp. WL]|uniref:hypothetical protein n=1 Tax=Caenibius sp. WL TaxID=2872646 RepID=UPI001C99F2B4|nr:hypothetical protein [Caenibius sp. WL]QZP07662.1 hypothetical protein K5X80_13510 [Caenibius sp. WL]